MPILKQQDQSRSYNISKELERSYSRLVLAAERVRKALESDLGTASSKPEIYGLSTTNFILENAAEQVEAIAGSLENRRKVVQFKLAGKAREMVALATGEQ